MEGNSPHRLPILKKAFTDLAPRVLQFLAQAEVIADKLNELELKGNSTPDRREEKKLWQAFIILNDNHEVVLIDFISGTVYMHSLKHTPSNFVLIMDADLSHLMMESEAETKVSTKSFCIVIFNIRAMLNNFPVSPASPPSMSTPPTTTSPPPQPTPSPSSNSPSPSSSPPPPTRPSDPPTKRPPPPNPPATSSPQPTQNVDLCHGI
ncbi:early nodulin-20-like [Olea europaea var. sylvestris]|uniref:early nodulin-20-like n=1 Tax=Olea europaea var. sylvestris TaxID=158386 RepID=UPI000C1D45E8|nr:early nodulin-20-like [Olea europaea var. sylvestris]